MAEQDSPSALWSLLLAVWLLIIVAITTLPWGNFDGQAHWDRVQWIPFSHFSWRSPRRWLETIANVVLFIPLGFLVVRVHRAHGLWAGVIACGAGLAVSMSAELFQVFTVRRFPTMTDLCTNTFGSLCGAMAADRWGGPA